MEKCEGRARTVGAHTGIARRCGALLLSLLMVIAQAGPALACAVFDGPAGPGCPAMFRGASGYDLSPPAVGETGGNGGQGTPPEDCSAGPAYLVPDGEPQQVSSPLAAHPDVHPPDVHPPERLAAGDALAPTVLIVPNGLLPPTTASGGRHIYLTTLRLRI